MRRERTDEAGFTLLELLVTITLLAMLSLLLFGGLRFGVRAWDGAQAHGAGMDEMRVVQNLLQRELEQAYPAYDVATDPVNPTVAFSGDENGVDFLAPAPQAMLSQGRAHIVLAGARDGGHLALVMRAHPELAMGNAGSWSEPLLRDVAAIRFSYFGAPTVGGTPSWVGRWPGGKTMPQLVRIHVEFPRGDARSWPDLIVAPRIEVDAGCVYDYVTKYCQGRR
jgi:general secretion pathway protein J